MTYSQFSTGSLPLKTVEWVSDTLFVQLSQMPKESGTCFVNYSPYHHGPANRIQCVTNDVIIGTLLIWLTVLIIIRQTYVLCAK